VTLNNFNRRLAKLEEVADRRKIEWFVEHNHDNCTAPYYAALGQYLSVKSREEAEALFPDLKINWIVVHHVEGKSINDRDQISQEGSAK
jgi:hypothetical protein